jgi:putrescine aminotransferase
MNPRPNLYPTAELKAKDSAHYLHPFTDYKSLSAEGARVIVEAKGVWLTDSDGNRMLDGMAGLWTTAVGHGRHEIAEAVYLQMQELAYYNSFFKTTNPPAILLAEKLAQLSPPQFNHVFYTSSGSEANDTILRLVRWYWSLRGKPKKKIVLARRNAYHGSTVAGASLGGMVPMHEQGDLPIPNIHHIPQPYWFAEGGDMSPDEFGLHAARALEKAIDVYGEDNIAAFIAEPIQGAGGVIVPPANFWPLVREVCDRHGVLLIADEVVTGFGRTGQMFGTRTWGVQADLWCLAKGISSGYVPLGATAISRHVAEVFDADTTGAGQVAHGYTYSAHPVAAAAALATLDVLERDDIPSKVRDVSGPFQSRLRGLVERSPFVGDVRGIGLMVAIEMVADKASKAPLPKTSDLPARVAREAYRRGLMTRVSGANMILSPPLVISAQEVDFLCTTLEAAFDAVAA